MIVDTHHHIWDPAARRHAWLDGLPGLRRRFDLTDYAAAAAGSVTASVLVQVLASTEETEEFLALAAGSVTSAAVPAVAGVVGWVDLTRGDVREEISRLRELPGGDRLVGLRHLVQDEASPEWLDRPEVRRGLRAAGDAGLPFDLLIRPAQLPAALRVTADLDSVAFVLDHGAKPAIASGHAGPWSRLVGELAARPNVTCKLSGLVTEAGPGWTTDMIMPYVDRLLGCFGPGRLMFGSDWPVCTTVASLGEVIALARTTLERHLGPAELDATFRSNAIATYRLRFPGPDGEAGGDAGRTPGQVLLPRE
jgi:L-fuconolactonase